MKIGETACYKLYLIMIRSKKSHISHRILQQYLILCFSLILEKSSNINLKVQFQSNNLPTQKNVQNIFLCSLDNNPSSGVFVLRTISLPELMKYFPRLNFFLAGRRLSSMNGWGGYDAPIKYE